MCKNNVGNSANLLNFLVFINFVSVSYPIIFSCLENNFRRGDPISPKPTTTSFFIIMPIFVC